MIRQVLLVLAVAAMLLPFVEAKAEPAKAAKDAAPKTAAEDKPQKDPEPGAESRAPSTSDKGAPKGDADEPPKRSHAAEPSEPSEPRGVDRKQPVPQAESKVVRSGPSPAVEPPLASEAAPSEDQSAEPGTEEEPLQEEPLQNNTSNQRPSDATQEAAKGPVKRAGSGAPTQADASEPDPLESQRRWVGGLLNATQDPREQEAEAQTVAAPLIGSQWMLLIFGIGVGASMSAIGVRHHIARRPDVAAARNKPGPPNRSGLDALVQRVARAPMDAAACFQLGIELLRLGIEKDGLRLLDRSIRLDPLLIVRLVQEPEYKSVTQSAGVKRLLADVKRNYDRRLLTAYA